MASLRVANEINKMGAYVLETIDTEEILYIGSSQEVNDAKDRHLYKLKNGFYTGKKQRLTDEYNKDNLQIRVVFTCFDNDELAIIEEQLIGCQYNYLCNVQRSVKRHSSNKDRTSTLKRHIANVGDNNPNCKYDKKIMAEIIWCKLNGYKPKQLAEIYKDIPKEYISQIGVYKWVGLEPIKPDWIVE